MRRIIVFEDIATASSIRLRRALDRGDDVRFLNPESVPPESERLKDLERTGRPRHLALPRPLYLNNDPTVDEAFERIDQAYDRARQADPGPLRAALRLYRNADIELAFRKHLLHDLWRCLHLRSIQLQLAGLFPGQTVVFVPTDPRDSALSDGLGRLLGLPDDPSVRIPFLGRLAGYALLRLRGLRAAAACASIAGRSLLSGLRFLRQRQARRDYPYAVAIVSPMREFANDYRRPGFLLDGSALREDNTLFVPLEPLSREQKDLLSRRGLTVADMAPALPLGDCVRLFWTAVGLAVRLCLRQGRFAPATATLIKEYWRWSGFLSRYRVERFVSYADCGLRQIGRNVLLKNAGTETWHYTDTENLGALNHKPPKGAAHRHIYWSYLYYDRCIVWSQRVIDYYRTHHQAVGRYDAAGVLWSEMVHDLRKRAESTATARMLRQAGWSETLKLVAVFDSTYNNLSRTTYEDGVAFARAFERLLQDLPGIYIAWKEKKPRWTHPDKGSYGLMEIYERLAGHPRCHFLDYRHPSEELLAACDLCICFPFTSSAAEAMGARIKSLYYAPHPKFGGSYFDSIPGLVAHDYAELVERVRTLLFGPDGRYDDFLDSHIKDRLDPYLDGHALTRLRRMIAESNLARPRQT